MYQLNRREKKPRILLFYSRWPQGYLKQIKQNVEDNQLLEASTCPTSDHEVAGSNPAGGEILPKPKRRFIEQSLSCSPFHRLEMTEILLKGRKTVTHPPINQLLIHLMKRPNKSSLITAIASFRRPLFRNLLMMHIRKNML